MQQTFRDSQRFQHAGVISVERAAYRGQRRLRNQSAAAPHCQLPGADDFFLARRTRQVRSLQRELLGEMLNHLAEPHVGALSHRLGSPRRIHFPTDLHANRASPQRTRTCGKVNLGSYIH